MLGKVKTRLAVTVGNVRALQVYRQLLNITRIASLGVDCQRQLYYSNAIEQDDAWPNVFFEKHRQVGADLGARMHHAFSTSFAEGATTAVLIGSDCPEISAALISTAFDTLEGHDIVLGPAEDGGYYLIGMKTVNISLFENMKWSTASLLEDTLARVSKLGLHVKMLPQLSDLDNEQDLLTSGL